MHDLTDLDSGFSVFEINLQEKRLTYLASAQKLKVQREIAWHTFFWATFAEES